MNTLSFVTRPWELPVDTVIKFLVTVPVIGL